MFGGETRSLFSLIVYATVVVRHVAQCAEYKLGLLIPYDSTYDGKMQGELLTGKYYAAAISVAVDAVNADPTLLPGSTLSFVWNNTQCNPRKIAAQQKWQVKQGVVGFIGPSCYTKKAIKLARSYNKDLPVISYGSQDTSLSKKSNFARVNPSNYKSASEIIRVLKMRGWRKVTILCQKKHYWRSFKRYLIRALEQENIAIKKQVMLDSSLMFMGPGPKTARKALNQESQATIFLNDFPMTQEILTILQRKGRLDKNPNYGFIATHLQRSSVDNWIKYPFKWFFSMFYGTANINVTEKALERLLLVTIKPYVTKTKGYVAFQEALKKKTRLEPFNSDVYHGCHRYFEFNHTVRCLFNKSTAMPPYSGAYLYDAVMQFAEGLHKVLKSKKEISGTNIVNALKRKEFIGIDGHKYAFDENADVKYEFTVLGIKKDHHKVSNMLPLTPQEILAV